jgi:hypothetical protein
MTQGKIGYAGGAPCLATPEEARRLWNSLAKPSIHTVAAMLTQNGKRVSYETIRKWKNNGWRPAKSSFSPQQLALKKLDTLVSKLPGGETRLSDFVPAEALRRVNEDATRDRLAMATDSVLIDLMARTLHITGVTMMEEICKHREFMLKNNPDGLAEVLKALTGLVKIGGDSYTQSFLARERSMKLEFDAEHERHPEAAEQPQLIPPGADPLIDGMTAYNKALTVARSNGKA